MQTLYIITVNRQELYRYPRKFLLIMSLLLVLQASYIYLVAELVQCLCVVLWFCFVFKTKPLFPSVLVLLSRILMITDVSGPDASISLPTFDMKKMGLHIQSITLLSEYHSVLKDLTEQVSIQSKSHLRLAYFSPSGKYLNH